jgi:DNA-binding NtrC family response regulator
MGQADGQEVLVFDGDEKVQRGLQQLLAGAGLVPTVLADAGRARALLKEKYFPVVVIDLDTPEHNAGLELVRAIKQDAPMSIIIVLASRKAFESAVEAFRAGATDVVVKAPDQVEYLKRRVVECCSEMRARSDDDRLIGEVITVHEEFLKRLMETSRRASELEEKLGGGAAPSAEEEACEVLVVEPYEDGWLAGQLGDALRGRADYRLRICGSGGEGMDVATGVRFQIALISSQLPDLPGRMVINALKQGSPETIAILYTRPGATPGTADIIEGSKAIALVPEFRDVRQMLERIDELREAFRRKSAERRYLVAFRQENYDLLRRYAELKQRLARASSK